MIKLVDSDSFDIKNISEKITFTRQIMGKFKLYDTSIPPEIIVEERAALYLSKSPQEKWNELLALIRLSISLNGGQPLKKPQGKGLIIQKSSE